MKTKIKQLLCGITQHQFKSVDTDSKYDNEKDTITITETCCRCGKQFSFTAPSRCFGLTSERGKSNDTNNK